VLNAQGNGDVLIIHCPLTICTYWRSGRARRENIWLRSGLTDLAAGPPTQSI